MKVIILGASGQIGRHLYDRIGQDKDLHVIGTSRKGSEKLKAFDPFKDDWKQLGKAEVIINCIGQIRESKGNGFSKIHLGVTKEILKNRSLLGNPRIIQISVLGADEKAKSGFLNTKAVADKLLLEQPNTLVVRPSIVCTPGTVMIQKLLMVYKLSKLSFNYALLPKGLVNHEIQPILIDDLTELIHILCKKETSGVINAPGPQAISYGKLIQMLFELKDKKLKVIELPKSITDIVVKNFIAVALPDIISRGQYDLIFKDNVADKTEAEKNLDRPLSNTLNFWKKEFAYANH